MSDQSPQPEPVSVAPKRVIQALHRKLGEANNEVVMLEALVNQQQEELASLGEQVLQLSEALEAARDDVPTNPDAPLELVGE